MRKNTRPIFHKHSLHLQFFNVEQFGSFQIRNLLDLSGIYRRNDWTFSRNILLYEYLIWIRGWSDSASFPVVLDFKQVGCIWWRHHDPALHLLRWRHHDSASNRIECSNQYRHDVCHHQVIRNKGLPPRNHDFLCWGHGCHRLLINMYVERL